MVLVLGKLEKTRQIYYHPALSLVCVIRLNNSPDVDTRRCAVTVGF